MIVVLIGYMASGKSTIGKALAKQLDFNFLDLDDFIEKEEQLSVKQIFETKGEIYFRTAENKYLKQLLTLHSNLVIALGGGTPCYHNNMDIIINAKNVTSVYLEASINTLLHRLTLEKAKRPLIAHLNDNDALVEFIGKHLFERSGYYNQAQHILTIDNKSIETIVNQLRAILK